MKKFYVGAKHIAAAIHKGIDAGGTVSTVDEALEEAKKQVRSREVDCAVVVEIIYIVKRDEPPVTVIRV